MTLLVCLHTLAHDDCTILSFTDGGALGLPGRGRALTADAIGLGGYPGSPSAPTATVLPPNRYGPLYRRGRHGSFAGAETAGGSASSAGSGHARALSGGHAAGSVGHSRAGSLGRRAAKLRKGRSFGRANGGSDFGAGGAMAAGFGAGPRIGGSGLAGRGDGLGRSSSGVVKPGGRYRFRHVRFNRAHARITYAGAPLSIRDFCLVLDARVYQSLEGSWRTILNK